MPVIEGRILQSFDLGPRPERNALVAGLSSGTDDLQGLGYSALGAMADTFGADRARDWLNEQADRNQRESQLNGRPDLERVEDVWDKPSKWLPYATYQVAKQVPNIGGAIAAGLVVPEVAVPAALSRGAALLPRALGGGGMAARVAEAAATGGSEFAARRAALEAGQTFAKQVVGGGAFNYGQGVGSLYQEAVEGGDPNSGAAALAGGLPYALTETLPEAMLVGRIGHGAGFQGNLLTRIGKAGATQGATGATSELLQNEMEMAYNGRVSPDDAFSKRLNSGVAGGLVEGLMGLPGGIRSGRRAPTPSIDQTGGKDLLNPGGLTTAQGFEGVDTGAPLQAPIPNRAYDPALGDLTPEWTTTQGFEGVTAIPRGLDVVGPQQELPQGRPSGTQIPAIDTSGLTLAIDDPRPYAGDGRPVDPRVEGAVAPTLQMPAVNLQGDTVHADSFGNLTGNPVDTENMTDPGAAMARQVWLANKARQDEIKRQADEHAARIEALRAEAAGFGLQGDKAVGLFGELKALHESGQIQDGDYAESIGELKTRRFASVRKFIDAKAEHTRLQAEADAKPITPVTTQGAADVRTTGQAQPVAQGTGGQPGVAPLRGERAAGSVPVVAGQRVDGAVDTPAPGASRAAGVAVPGGSGVAPAVAGIDPNKTTTVGRSGRERAVTAQQVSDKILHATPLQKSRILLATGWDITEDPDTGAPILVEGRDPMPFAEIARVESERTGKKVTRQAITSSLKDFGIDERVALASAVSPDAINASELGLDNVEAGDAPGFRVEDTLGAAAGDGHLTGDAPTTAQRKLAAEADDILRKAGPAPAKREDAVVVPEGAIVTDLRTLNAPKRAENIRRLLGSPLAEMAADEWRAQAVDNAESGGAVIPSWEDLHDAMKADWVSEFGTQLKSGEGEIGNTEAALLAKFQLRISNDHKQAPPTKVPAANSGRTQANTGVQAVEREGGGPQAERTDQGAASRAEQDVTDVEPREVAQEPARHLSKDTLSRMSRGELSAERPQLSKVAGPGRQSSTVDAVKAELKGLGLALQSPRLVVVQDASELPPRVQKSLSKEGPKAKRVQGFVTGGRVYLIAGNIKPGNARSVLMHEAGVHLGLEEILTVKEFQRLTDQILDWSEMTDGSQEAGLARKALARIINAGTLDEQKRSELAAYFVEEAVRAGVDPTAMKYRTNVERWMSTLVAALKKGLAKLRLGSTVRLTAQDVVDMAYGAAHFQLGEDTRGGSTESKYSYAGEGATGPNPDIRFSVEPDAGPIPSPVSAAARRVAGATGSQVVTDVTHTARRLADSLSFLHDLVDDLKGSLPSIKDWYKGVQDVQATRNKLKQDAERVAAAAERLPGGTQNVNEFLSKSTFQQKWGYDPSLDPQHKDLFPAEDKAGEPVKYEVDPTLQRDFNLLKPEEQQVVRDVFAHGQKMLKVKRGLMKALKLDDVDQLTSMGAGSDGKPYAPLKRFGDYVAVLKSKELRDAEQADDASRVKALKQDPNHYVVSYFDTPGQAALFAEKNSKAGGGGFDWSDHFEKSAELADSMAPKHATLQRLLAAMGADEAMPKATKEALTKMVQDMYFQSIDEHHARTSTLKRMNRAGYDSDMVRSFLSHARADANWLANLEHGGKINEAFYRMQREARNPLTGKREHQNEFNAIADHYRENLSYKETPWTDRAMALTSAWQLLTSLGYHVANATQGFMVTLPKLAADFGDYSGAWKHLSDGYKALKDTGVWGQLQLERVKNPGLRGALQRAADMGVLDIGLDEDLTHFEATRTGYAPVDAASKGVRTALHKLRQVSRAVETANRVAAATAAYNMAIAKGRTEEAAQEYAVRILQTTQGDFSRTGAPLLLKRLPKVMTQYRKYQFMMAALYTRAFKQAFTGATPEERAIGKRMLAFKLFHTSMAAGVLGLPAMNLVGLVMGALFGGDDEPWSTERQMREWIGDPFVADLLLHGPLNMVGLDMSSKLGDDKVFSIAPYTDFKFGSASEMAQTLGGILGGPTLSQAGRFAEGVGYFKRGDFYRGVEQLMPKGPADAMKAARIANEGYTLKNGDVMVKPDDVNEFALALDAVGLKSTSFKNMEWLRSQQYEVRQFYQERTKDIEHRYAEAMKADDYEKAAKLRQDWQELQDGKDNVRHWFNDQPEEMKRQPLSTLLKYPKAQADRERKLQKAMPQ